MDLAAIEEKMLEANLILETQNILIEKKDVSTYDPALMCRLKERCTMT